MQKRTIIIFALFCCGKTSLCNNNSSNYSIIDLDEELETKQKTKTFLRGNEIHDMEQKYLLRVKECIGHYNFILLPIKYSLKKLIAKNNIPYVLVYPKDTMECKIEWKRRNMIRNTEWIWDAYKRSWSKTLSSLDNDKNAIYKYRLNKDQYLSSIIELIATDNKITNIRED